MCHFILSADYAGLSAHNLAPRLFSNFCLLYCSSWRENFFLGQANKKEYGNIREMVRCKKMTKRKIFLIETNEEFIKFIKIYYKTINQFFSTKQWTPITTEIVHKNYF